MSLYYKYDGPLFNPYDLIALKSEYYIAADNIFDAEIKFERKISREKRDKITIDPTFIKEVESRWEKQRRLNRNPYENTCDECGTQLTDNGDCPVCDYGEEDLLEVLHKLDDLED